MYSFDVGKMIANLEIKIGQRAGAIDRAQDRMNRDLVAMYRYLGRLIRNQDLDESEMEVLQEIKETGQKVLTQVEYNLALDEAERRTRAWKGVL